jgi:hypothetical protein
MNKAKKITIIILLFSSLLIICFCIALSVILPAYLEKRLLPDIVQQSGIEGLTWNVRRIGLTGADFEAVIIDERSLETLSVNSVQLNYSPAGLLRRHLTSIHVCGLSLAIELKEGKILFPGIDLNRILSENNTSTEKKGWTKQPLPLSFDRIVIEPAIITAKLNQKTLRITGDITILPLNESFDLLKCVINFYTFESTIRAEAQLDLDSGALKIFCDFQNLSLENYLYYLTSDNTMHVKGNMDFTAYLETNLDSFENSAVNISMESKEFLFLSENLKLEKSKENTEAVSVKVESEGLTDWKISTSGLSATSPMHLEFPEIRADLRIVPEGLECHFQLDTILKRFDNQDLEINPPFHRQWNGSAGYFNNADWIIDMEIIPPEVLSDKQMPEWYRIKSTNTDVGFFMPKVVVSGEGNLEKGHATGDLKMSGIYLDTHAISMELPSVIFKAEMVPDVENASSLNFKARLMNTEIRAGATNATFDDISFIGQTDLSELEKIVHATFKITGGELSDAMYDAVIKGIDLELPLIWPPNQQADTGSFNIEALRFKEKDLGKIRATLRQDGHGVEITGAYDSRFFPGMVLRFDGSAKNTQKGLETRLDYELPTYKSRNNFNLGDFFPGAEGIFLDGQLRLNGEFYKLGPKMTSSVHIDAQDLNIFMKEGLEIQSVKIDFTLADLFELRSLPHQHIQFDTATIGNIKLNDGSIYFQMQSVDRFFIEKTSFKWCGGNVDTNASTISIPIENVGITLYCDRLKLAQVLEQLGGFKGEGEGAVNGRIPIRYDDGNFRFDDGFLYSTPGDGGTISLMETDILMTGIPEGTPQFSQIDLAREALKNYQYDWAILEITTERENLNLGLKLDGKPVDVLPFEYRQDFGGFVRVDAESPGSRFEGIRLDVNFNLPLDQVLKYGKGLRDIFKLNN